MGKNGKRKNGKQMPDGKSPTQPKASDRRETEFNIPFRRPQSAPASSPKAKAKGKNRSMSEPAIISNDVLSNKLSPCLVPINPSLRKRFYEALVILAILGQNRGEYQEEEELEPLDEPFNLDNEKLRRSFAKSLAYLCDYDKGGPQTTAVALQQTPQGVVYWFASNQMPGREDRVKLFVVSILNTLKSLENCDASQVEAELFGSAVRFASKRIVKYTKLLRPEVDFLLGYLDEFNLARDLSFTTWLRDLDESLNSGEAACRFCYISRHSPEYQDLQWRARDGAPCHQRFNKLRHYVGRLNHTMKAVKIVVAAVINLPRLLDVVEVIRAPSSLIDDPPLVERKPSLHELVGRMGKSEKEIEDLRSSLRYMDQKYGLSELLKEKCVDENWKPIVHAEITLLDLFWTRSFNFVGGDRFIGCSKPACYCCFLYIQAHPGRWVLPACHNNHWINWKPPDIFDDDRIDLISCREKILNAMAQKIRDEVFQQINERRAPAQWQPDSHTEISADKLQHGGHAAKTPFLHVSHNYTNQEVDSDTSSLDGQSDMSVRGQEFEEEYIDEEDQTEREDVEVMEGESTVISYSEDEDETDDEDGGAPLFAGLAI